MFNPLTLSEHQLLQLVEMVVVRLQMFHFQTPEIYMTGSSGQRILTGQVQISRSISGQSMRWKLALVNNTVKIHGVDLFNGVNAWHLLK